jgi:hypothetical protein
MADFSNDFDDLREGQKAALGGKMQRAINKQENKQQEFQEQYSLRDLMDTLKDYGSAKSVGKQPKEENIQILTEIVNGLQVKVEYFLTKAIGSISPVVRKELVEISRLLDTGSKTDEILAMQKLEDLQKKFSNDLKLLNKNLGENFNKLTSKLQKSSELLANAVESEKNRLQQAQETRKAEIQEKKRKSEETQEELLRKGIKTSVNEKTGQLKYLSPQEIQKKEQTYEEHEKDIKVLEQELKVRLLQPGEKQGGEFSKKQKEDIAVIQKGIKTREEELQIIKREIGEKQGRKKGTLESAFGEAFGQLKDVFGGFALDAKNLGGLFSGMGKKLFGKTTEVPRAIPELEKVSKLTPSTNQTGIVKSISKTTGGLTRTVSNASKASKAISAGRAVAGTAEAVGGVGAAAGGAGAAAGGVGLMALLPEILPVILAILAVVAAVSFIGSLFGGNKDKKAAKENLENPNVDANGNIQGSAIKPLEEKSINKNRDKISSEQLNKLSEENVDQQNQAKNVAVMAPQQNTVANMSNSTTVTNPIPFNTEASYRNLMTTVW